MPLKMICVAALAAGLALTGCSAGIKPGSASSPPVSQSSAAPMTSPAQPETAAGVRAAAADYFALYSAGQFATSYPLLSTQARHAVSEHVWIAVHKGCKSPSAGMAYKIGRVTLVGNTAVVAVSLSGALASLGSETETFTYSVGKWGYTPSDLSVYRGRTPAKIIAAFKAQGYCAS